jgi:hypothetical protein
MYDPTVGRFLNEDPSDLDGGDMNLYRYVKNNPLNNTDPTGLCSKSLWGGDSYGYSSGLNLSNNYGLGDMSGLLSTPQAKDFGLPVATFSFPGGDVGVAATSSGATKYYLGGQEISQAKLDTFLEKSSPPQDARQASFMIAARQPTYQERAAGEFTGMFQAAPPTGKGLPTSYTADDYRVLGNALAGAYVGTTQDFLKNNPGAAPRQAMRVTDVYRYYTGTVPTRQEVAASPVCEDWAAGVNAGLQNAKSTVTLSSGTYPLAKFYETNWGQKWGPLESTLGITAGQHNFTVVYPKGYTPSNTPGSDPVIRVADPWHTLLPSVYTTSGYQQTTGKRVDAIGPNFSDCRPR